MMQETKSASNNRAVKIVCSLFVLNYAVMSWLRWDAVADAYQHIKPDVFTLIHLLYPLLIVWMTFACFTNRKSGWYILTLFSVLHVMKWIRELTNQLVGEHYTHPDAFLSFSTTQNAIVYGTILLVNGWLLWLIQRKHVRNYYLIPVKYQLITILLGVLIAVSFWMI